MKRELALLILILLSSISFAQKKDYKLIDIPFFQQGNIKMKKFVGTHPEGFLFAYFDNDDQGKLFVGLLDFKGNLKKKKGFEWKSKNKRIIENYEIVNANVIRQSIVPEGGDMRNLILKYAVLGKNMNMLTGFSYDEVIYHSDRTPVLVKKDGRFHLIKPKKEKILKSFPQWMTIDSYDGTWLSFHGLNPDSGEFEAGYIDMKGEKVLDAPYGKCGKFDERGYAPFYEGKDGTDPEKFNSIPMSIDKFGNVIQFSYLPENMMGDEVFLKKGARNHSKISDFDHNILLQDFHDAIPINERYWLVTKSNEYQTCLYDKDGNEIIPVKENVIIRYERDREYYRIYPEGIMGQRVQVWKDGKIYELKDYPGNPEKKDNGPYDAPWEPPIKVKSCEAGTYGLMQEKRFISDTTYQQIESEKEGCYFFIQNNRYGWMDKKGEPYYLPDSLRWWYGGLNEGHAIVSPKMSVAVWDRAEEKFSSWKYRGIDEVGHFQDGLAIATTYEKPKGGQVTIYPQNAFWGLPRTRRGLVDTQGDWVVPPIFSDITYPNRGVSVVRVGYKPYELLILPQSSK